MSELRRLVEQRGESLRQLSREDLVAAGNQPTEDLRLQGRSATIDIIVEPRDEGSLRVVVAGFMHGRVLGIWTWTAFDGFYLRPDGKIDPVPVGEFYEFD